MIAVNKRKGAITSRLIDFTTVVTYVRGLRIRFAITSREQNKPTSHVQNETEMEGICTSTDKDAKGIPRSFDYSTVYFDIFFF